MKPEDRLVKAIHEVSESLWIIFFVFGLSVSLIQWHIIKIRDDMHAVCVAVEACEPPGDGIYREQILP